MMLLSPFLLLLFLLPHNTTASDLPPPSQSTHTSTECSRLHMVEAVKASSHCGPMIKVVKLDIPGNGSYTQMTPQFVEAKRCGGGCHSPSHSCVSTERITRQIPVLLFSCGLTAGLCSKSCATLAIEEDSACRCDCFQGQRVCNNSRHSFNTQECKCECRVDEEYTLCRDQGRVWDNDECVCRCPVEMNKPCSTGLIFDLATCSCITEEASDIPNMVTDERVERSDINDDDRNGYDHGEMVIIVALSGVITVFFVIIISLLHSVKTLTRSIISIRADKVHTKGSEQFLLTTQKR